MSKIKFYETAEDRIREKSVANKLMEFWGCKLVAMPKHTFFDFCVVKDEEVVSYVEIKTRKNRHNAYPTYMISSLKISRGLEAARTLGIKFLLAVEWTDRLMYLDVEKADFKLKIGGTTKRNDERDVEIVAHFAIDQFIPITLALDV